MGDLAAPAARKRGLGRYRPAMARVSLESRLKNRQDQIQAPS